MRRAFFLALLGLIFGATAMLWYLSQHGFSAREKPLVVETIVAKNLRRLAIPAEAREMKNPLEGTPLEIAEARDHFADHCAVCHGNRGDGKTKINEGLYPPAPNMRDSETQSLSDGELFYIIKNGIRFTGMPGWGGSDLENWKLVSFIRHLSHLSDKEYGMMTDVNGLK